jgi:peptidoglycan/LPS O-acetylase OafA/YrhL
MGVNVRGLGSQGRGVTICGSLLALIVGLGINLLSTPMTGDWVSKWWVGIATAVLVAAIAGALLQRGRVLERRTVRAIGAIDAGMG